MIRLIFLSLYYYFNDIVNIKILHFNSLNMFFTIGFKKQTFRNVLNWGNYFGNIPFSNNYLVISNKQLIHQIIDKLFNFYDIIIW